MILSSGPDGRHESPVTTVLGPVGGDLLGRVDAHEHVFLRSPVLPGEHFQDEDRMEAELRRVRDSGIDTVVDLTPIGLGRRASATARLSRHAGVHVVLATGIHRSAHYPAGHWLYTAPDDAVLDCLVTDLTEGIDDNDWQGPRPHLSSARAGIVKLGASYHHVSAAEQRWFRLGAQAALQAGVPVAVHTEIGTSAHEVLDQLELLGIGAHRVMLAHLDRNPDVTLHVELAARGAYLGYDTVGRVKYRPDSALLDLVEQVTDLGHGNRILLGTDVGRRSSLLGYGGGPGMDVLGRVFAPRLRRQLGAGVETTILVDNPRAYLCGSAA